MEKSPKRPRVHDDGPQLPESLSLRQSKGKGNGVFALKDIEANWCWRDHAVCIACEGGRRLPSIHNVDELMEELVQGSRSGNHAYELLLRGRCKMSHIKRHLDIQDVNADTLPEWARKLDFTPDEYNMLVAQLQSNVARHHDGESYVLWPTIHLTNHDCDGNMEIGLEQDDKAHCSCGIPDYLLRARRDIKVHSPCLCTMRLITPTSAL